jgi:hypothetical protein
VLLALFLAGGGARGFGVFFFSVIARLWLPHLFVLIERGKIRVSVGSDVHLAFILCVSLLFFSGRRRNIHHLKRKKNNLSQDLFRQSQLFTFWVFCFSFWCVSFRLFSLCRAYRTPLVTVV